LSIVNDEQPSLPNAFTVSNNYPNPFNPSTTINISLPNQTELVVSVYDMSGRLVNRMINDNMDAGIHTVQWDGRNQSGYFVPTGVYFMQVISGENQHMQKMALIK
ncbi:MAG: T9SS type A sorting domain-containing protein, partial [Candidatus Marinimicrobia bacterium]|nr:T9SS type A sorting domain-containing protein [Candidatus Neomarinimicrobiota bacterium]